MRAVLRRAYVCSLGLLAVSGFPGPASGQAPDQFPYFATLTTDDYVRAGADVRYYPFGQVYAGDVVKVIGEKAGWARIAAVGPAFDGSFGFIKYPKTSSAHFVVNPDGKGGTTAAPTDVFAPNLDAKLDPASSWKPAVTLPATRTVVILETVTLGDELIHKVELPDDAEGWIDLKQLRAAASSEIAAWEAATPRRQVRPQSPQPQPAPPAVRTEVVPVNQGPLGRAQPNIGVAIEPEPAPTATASPIRAPQPVSPAARKRIAERRMVKIMLDDLETAYARLLAEPVESAEVEPLRLLYLDLAERQESRSISKFAQTRARQLELWAEVQQRRVEMVGVLRRAQQATQTAAEARLEIEAFDIYAAVGRLDASTIYDGKRLPRLLRIRDETGRTLGYVEPDERFEYANLLGHRVGVVGEKIDDGGLRVLLIEPRRIDVLDSGN